MPTGGKKEDRRDREARPAAKAEGRLEKQKNHDPSG
jgi:hypothetical protein